jgi:hypothetical protein
MHDLLLALAFIAMVVVPGLVAMDCITATDDSDKGIASPAQLRAHPRIRAVGHMPSSRTTMRTPRNTPKYSLKIALRSPSR